MLVKFLIIADAVVVGSAIIHQIEEYSADQDKMLKNIKNLLSSMRIAMDNVVSEDDSNQQVA